MGTHYQGSPLAGPSIEPYSTYILDSFITQHFEGLCDATSFGHIQYYCWVTKDGS